MAELLSDVRIDPKTGKTFIVSVTTDIDSGTNTGTGGGKLIDAGATFKTSKIRKFDRVFNTTILAETFVLSIDSETELSLADDIFTVSPLDYEIKRIIGDAELISGQNVILQDTIIRIQTQIGTVKRQDLDSLGWDVLGQIKADVDFNWVSSTADKITEVVLEDSRIVDATVEVNEFPDKNLFIFDVKFETEEGEFLSFPLALPT